MSAPASRLERRRARLDPVGQVWPGMFGKYPMLVPRAWYQLHTSSKAHPDYVWLTTGHGLTRVDRTDVEIRGQRW